MLAGKIVTHTGRTLEVLARSRSSPHGGCDLGGRASRLDPVCRQATYFTYGANFGSDIGQHHQAAVQALLEYGRGKLLTAGACRDVLKGRAERSLPMVVGM